jgi:hypothetical protein
MNRIVPPFLGLLIFTTILPIGAQDLMQNKSVTGICYASNKVNKYYIPPPASFFRKANSKNGASITIYCTGFTSQGVAAMDYAVSILEKLLPADSRFTIKATWEKISTEGVLAQSTITGYAAGGGIDAQNPLSLYPVALAEKIAGKSLNDDLQGDITLSVNSSINWYLGTDGNTPVTKYDLITVAIHEICHGLGFFDSFDVSNTTGSWGISTYPMIYDTFIENFSGTRLIDTLKILNNSTGLKSQLTGNQVYFNGPLLRKYSSSVNYSNLRAKLYAPETWESGSSISHLDEPSSVTLRINSLMTPYIDLGEAIHDPGKYTLSILGDLGWINTRIIHKPAGDTETHISQLLLSATIKSDTTYNHNRVGVVYSFDNFHSSDSIFMSSPTSSDTYSTTINFPSYNSELKYYFFVEDAFLRLYRSPSLFSKSPYKVYIGTDTIKPVITHTPVNYYLQTVDTIKFAAVVTDNLGIDSVYAEYKVNNGPSKFIRLKKGNTDNFSTVFNAKALSLKGHDSIEYKIFAVDTARIPNIAELPKKDFFVTHIEEISSTISRYTTDFSTAAPDFFNSGFQVNKPAGFSNYGLNSKHPYESPEDNNKTIEYTSMLRHPLKFTESGMLFSYNEVVLVEPGETGATFGSSGFYDYVIVEGSKNFGKTWFNLINGYNCSLFPDWETDYNSSKDENNSTFVGTEAMLQKHTFLYRPSDKISAGDTLLIRFRLYSDPFANGWGWVIENLEISPLIDAVKEVTNQQFRVYPNPGHGLIKFFTSAQDQESFIPIRYKVFNASGICLRDASTLGYSDTLIDISGYPQGMYYIILYMDDGIRTIKYSLIK